MDEKPTPPAARPVVPPTPARPLAAIRPAPPVPAQQPMQPAKAKLLKDMQSILEEYDGEGNIPIHHPYWGYLNDYRGLE